MFFTCAAWPAAVLVPYCLELTNALWSHNILGIYMSFMLFKRERLIKANAILKLTCALNTPSRVSNVVHSIPLADQIVKKLLKTNGI